MDTGETVGRLSQIQTLWSVVGKAHGGSGAEMAAARRQLLARYGGAVKRYLLGSLRDADAADELFQEFVLRFCRGDFHRANPEKGRFRNFVKSSLFHLVQRHKKRARRQPLPLPEEDFAAAADEEPGNSETGFRQSWRDELLARTWAALLREQQESELPYHDVLRHRVAHPEETSGVMAEQLTARLGRRLTAAAARQLLHRARERFSHFLLDEVAHTLDHCSTAELESELIELGLYEYCRAALQRRNG